MVDGSTKQALSPSKPTRSSEDLGLAFVFTDQGAQYINIGFGLAVPSLPRDYQEDRRNLLQLWVLMEPIWQLHPMNHIVYAC